MAILLSGNSLASAARRVALVVGNNEHVSSPKLENPDNDALLVSEPLRKIGFDVITVTNGTHRQMPDVRICVTGSPHSDLLWQRASCRSVR